jgi:exosortase A-associated hydrolase 2
LTAFFLPVEPGHRFCLYHPPAAGARPRGGIVYVHPFAEEMNKARRMAALQARRLAAAGWGVLQIDLLGCGDSSGEFAEARWAAWREDVRTGMGWLCSRVSGPMSLWGLRLGATLAADVARGPDMNIDRLVLWQPVASGEQLLTQFLRLHLAGEMLSGGAAQTGVRELREALARGTMLEIAGYELHPELAAAIEGLRLGELVPAAKTVIWQEVSAQPEPRITPASQRVLDAWRAAGVDVRAAAVAGEPFWTTLEIAECEALLDATDAALEGNN